MYKPYFLSNCIPPDLPKLKMYQTHFTNWLTVLFLWQQILRHSRTNASKAIFLITDGYSNGGDPRPVAAALRERGVEIFTLGIWQGNIRELHDMASQPKEQHCYLVHNFAEFEALARRALHEGTKRLRVNSRPFMSAARRETSLFRTTQPWFYGLNYLTRDNMSSRRHVTLVKLSLLKKDRDNVLAIWGQ